MKKLIPLLGIALLFSGCATKKAGTIENGIYTSGKGDFSLPLPMDISIGKNGTIKEAKDRVSFTRFYSSSVHVLSFEHNKSITDTNRYVMMKEILTQFYPDRPFSYERNVPDVQGGTTFAVWPQASDTPEKPRKLGLGGFWTDTRAVIVVANLPELLHVLPDNVPEEKQILILEKTVLDAARSITVHDPVKK